LRPWTSSFRFSSSTISSNSSKRVDSREQALARPEQDGRDGEVHLINEARLQVLPDRRHTAAESHVLTPGGVAGALQRFVDAADDEVKRGAALQGRVARPIAPFVRLLACIPFAVGCSSTGKAPSDAGTSAADGQNDGAPEASGTPPACDTDGGVTALVDNGLYVYQVAVDDSFAYLASFTGIYRVARTGGPLTLLTRSMASGGGQEAEGIAIDSMHVYFYSASAGGIFSAPIDGGTPTPLAAPFASTILVQDSVMYGGGPEVWSMPLDGGPATTLLTEGPDFILGAFAPFGGNMYATSTSPGPAEIVMASPDGGAPVILVPNRTQHPYLIAVDATGIYWGEWGSVGGVYHATLDGGNVTTLSADTPSSLAIDAVNVYWTSRTSGNIVVMLKSGGMATILASGQSAPNQLVEHGGNVYWCSQVTVDAGSDEDGGGGDEGGAAPTVLTTCK
jgi:hypothetical protein